ncbi:hypothetical protein EYF80_050813 [Liparis tanakae]|uniref:Uncharacterized protein n=1 Tax=Liparis tanakae TaxID=230148 RepID=A0A4Z2FDG3_9TELE|nr:hypothetical protein EYF80_050813 [Liparis tanakae]
MSTRPSKQAENLWDSLTLNADALFPEVMTPDEPRGQDTLKSCLNGSHLAPMVASTFLLITIRYSSGREWPREPNV